GTDPSEELGDLLFSCVNVARLAKVSSELVLQQGTEKFLQRFLNMEKAIKNDGKVLKDLTFLEMDVYWETGKSAEGKEFLESDL
ncbi:MAG: nucleoside triphosphate pyrophosphohydrolase, partial [Clostridiales bacterium]|nr:nucleoside triphosphate pyrophosphohydrolase [Clostridiales bacterium]